MITMTYRYREEKAFSPASSSITTPLPDAPESAGVAREFPDVDTLRRQNAFTRAALKAVSGENRCAGAVPAIYAQTHR